jgi:PAS domain S-box-containing protein
MRQILSRISRFAILAGDYSPPWRSQQARWVRDVTGGIALVNLVAALVILAGVLAGFFSFRETAPVYVLLLLSALAWWGARRGGWRWAALVPPVLCFLLGLLGSLLSGFLSTFVLFYGISIIVAGMLLGSRASLQVMLACIISYAILGSIHSGMSPDTLPHIIVFSTAMAGIYFLQWYVQIRLQQMIQAQIDANLTLTAEMAHRLQAEQALREQEAQLRRLADNTSDLIAEMDASGSLLFVSPSYRSVLGYDPESLVGVNAFALTHPDDQPAAIETALQAAATRQMGRLQFRTRCADGHYIHTEMTGNPLYDAQGQHTGYILTGRDISAQKLAEQALQESEEKFRAIIESLPLGIHMYTLEEDGRLVFSGYNQSAVRILNIDHAPMLGKTIEEAFPGLAGTEVPETYREIARTGKTFQNKQIDYHEGGIRGAYDVHSFRTTPGHMVTLFDDITERIRESEALRLSEEKFATAFLTSPDAIAINRMADGMYLDINEGFTQLLGYTREDVMGRSSLELSIWADRADRLRLVAGLTEFGVVQNLEARFRRKNGESGIGLMSARVIAVNEEKCILSITREITERIQAEIALRQNEAQLREAHYQLEQAYDATLEGWARALELRERETASHSRRVVELTMQVARAVGITGDDLIHVQRGALLHDIGKMGIPDGILLKPGRLTDDEWVTMRKHADFARTMLYDIEYLRPCLDIPCNHHEHWDGSGYPRGLKGEQIPLPARIFTVVDVYDALCHDRPYRPAWSPQEARRYLLEQRGKQFDPQIVEIFLRFV